MTEVFAGNASIIENLKIAAAGNRLPHAIIIEGEQGSGKHTLARFIAAAALCESSSPPCGKCRDCDLVSRNGHADVSVFEPEGATFKVSQVREIRNSAYIMPLEGKRKVYILAGADLMNKQAQNALLKIIEEPPEFLIFILLCENSESLLPTVRSRCIKFSVQLPERNEALEYLINGGADREAAEKAIDAAHGNIGKALAMLSDNNPLEARQEAERLLGLLTSVNRIESLKLLYGYEKKREKLLALLTELKLLMSDELRGEALEKSGSNRSVLLFKAIGTTDDYLVKIRQNGNLALLTTAFCADLIFIFASK